MVSQSRKTGRSRRRTSLRRQSEPSRPIHQKKSKSVSPELRQPSVPVVNEDVPRLSIADRFMSSNYPPSTKKPESISTTFSEPVVDTLSLADKFLSSSFHKEPGKLTIAEAFMSPRAASFAESSEVLSLEPSQGRPTFFDDNAGSILNLDLSLNLSSPTSSIAHRPWGSQETLVQKKQSQPIYNQYVEPATQFSLGEYDLEKAPEDLGKYEEYEDWDDEEEEEEEEESYNEEHPANSSIVGSTAKLQHHQHEQSQGFWVGCCFISCGRPKKREPEQHTTKRKLGFSRRGWVFCTFLSFIVLILIAYFLWPRTPLMRIEGASLSSPAKITETKQGVMVGNVAFESEWLVNITADNRQNHVPTQLVQVQVIAKDALTGLIIGKGVHNDDSNPEHILLAPNTISTIQIPIRVDYQARDSADTTFVDLIKACAPQRFLMTQESNAREALPLHFWITLHFFGLDWLGYKPTVIATPATGGFACPQS